MESYSMCSSLSVLRQILSQTSNISVSISTFILHVWTLKRQKQCHGRREEAFINTTFGWKEELNANEHPAAWQMKNIQRFFLFTVDTSAAVLLFHFIVSESAPQNMSLQKQHFVFTNHVLSKRENIFHIWRTMSVYKKIKGTSLQNRLH